MTPAACTVVLLNWNGWRDTLACVASVARSSPAAARIIVCDNGSSDDSWARLSEAFGRDWGSRLRLIQAGPDPAQETLADSDALVLLGTGRNLGFAGGMNAGLRLALQDPACTHVWLLNNDTEVAPDALAQALQLMQARPGVGLCGATLVYLHDRQTVQAWGGSAYSRATGRTRHLGYGQSLASRPDDARPVEASMACVVGAAMLVSRRFIETVGLMHEDYFLYFEEMDWAARARGRFQLAWAPACVVFHHEGASIGTAAKGGSPLSLYYLFRNRLRFAWRYHRAWVPLVFLSASLDVGRLLAGRRWAQAAAAARGLLQWPMRWPASERG